uniref:C-type lectin domain-containing protein n=1 Tax=Mola mola TaxID=94237 RepID=A0A3Q3W881_MOLML
MTEDEAAISALNLATARPYTSHLIETQNMVQLVSMFPTIFRISWELWSSARLNSSLHCPPGWTAHASRCFLLSEEQQEWAMARNKCKSLGGDLAVVLNADDQALMTIMTLKLVHHNPEKYFHSAWIGLSDTDKEGVFFWVNGDKLKSNVSFWSPGNPNNFIPDWDKHYEGQNCIAIVLPRHIQSWLYSWDDIICRGERKDWFLSKWTFCHLGSFVSPSSSGPPTEA